MILEYGAKNFSCFKEWMTIDLSLNKNVPDDISNGLPYSPVMCFKGANASGKTNALKALFFIFDFIRNSFKYLPDQDMPFDSFFMNDESSEFFIKFIMDSKIYSYEFEIKGREIVSEDFYEINKSEYCLFSRKKNVLSENNICPEKIIHLRSNASVLSTLNQYEVTGIKSFYDYFSNLLSNVSYIGMDSYYQEYFDSSKWYYSHHDCLDYMIEKIRMLDTGIENIKIKKVTNKDGKIEYYPIFSHSTDSKKKDLPLIFQSEGTKWLYKSLLLFGYVLFNGGVLVFDELDYALHENVLPVLLNDFLDPEINQKHSQIIFTTHNNEIMELTKKYRTYLFEKIKSESYCYRLDELPANVIRNDRPIVPLYKKGLLGGVPNIYERPSE